LPPNCATMAAFWVPIAEIDPELVTNKLVTGAKLTRTCDAVLTTVVGKASSEIGPDGPL
jgi:hypothetical protein